MSVSRLEDWVEHTAWSRNKRRGVDIGCYQPNKGPHQAHILLQLKKRKKRRKKPQPDFVQAVRHVPPDNSVNSTEMGLSQHRTTPILTRTKRSDKTLS